MKYQEAFKIVKELGFDTKVIFCKVNNIELCIFRPSIIPKTLKNKDYDVKKNFQIWLKEGEREFKPNHLRSMIDLNLRSESRPDLKKQLLKSFDQIYYGEDPHIAITDLEKEKFEHFLNPLIIIANMIQLFLIEQEYNYKGESQFEPPTLFFQGWIREFIDSPKEIDNMCMSVANGQPPKVDYTYKENHKHKKFEKNLPSLWYYK